MPYFFRSSSVIFLGSGTGIATSGLLVRRDNDIQGFLKIDTRLFLFHTTFGSGADAGFPPLASDARGPAWVPVFAIRRGFDAVSEDDPGGGVPVPARGLSVGFAVPLEGDALDARNVLLTETALKVAGFLTDDAERLWPLSPSFCPVREASVSEPPLILASAEFTWSSVFAARLFSSSSCGVVPFTDNRLASTS